MIIRVTLPQKKIQTIFRTQLSKKIILSILHKV